jgi:hypothetical protein
VNQRELNSTCNIASKAEYDPFVCMNGGHDQMAEGKAATAALAVIEGDVEVVARNMRM